MPPEPDDEKARAHDGDRGCDSTAPDTLDAALRRIDHLQAALINARMIGAAVGILMAATKRTYDGAFEMLANASQDRNEKLSTVAERVVLTGSPASSGSPGHVREVGRPDGSSK